MFNRYLIGIFQNESKLLAAVRCLRDNQISIHDVYSPYAIHGIDEAMGIRRSRLPFVTAIFGFLGLSLALFFQFWVAVIDWPINVGGKPDNSTLAFIPVAFEMTILFGGLGTVAFFFLRSKLFPGRRPKIFFEGISDNKFALVLEQKDSSFDEKTVEDILKEFGAVEVKNKVVNL